ncbi:MAG: sigma-70 family RNA polymerase sigma factor, partial [Verrucomicrobiota bacterium]
MITEYESSLLRYATRILRDENAAQDVVQNTFIKLHKAWIDGTTRPNRQLSGWLYRVTHNHAVDYIRRESRLRVLHEQQAEKLEEQEQER